MAGAADVRRAALGRRDRTRARGFGLGCPAARRHQRLRVRSARRLARHQDPERLLARSPGIGRGRSYLLVDLDGDGDQELVENELETTSAPLGNRPASPSTTATSRSAPRSTGKSFSPDLYVDPGSETPFLAIGAAKGRLLVIGGGPQRGDAPPARERGRLRTLADLVSAERAANAANTAAPATNARRLPGRLACLTIRD